MNFRTLIAVFVLFLTISLNSVQAQVGQEFAGNPVFPGWYADPEVIIYGDEYWIYPTYSAPYNEQLFFDCFSSKNLVDWTRHSKILTNKEVKWAWRAMWAPGVISKDGKYYLFFTANDVHPNEIGGIGVAVADSPGGPFKDHIGKPLINHIVNGAQPIDQYIFLDDDGTYYMYYGGWRHCNIVKLNEDFTGLVPFDDGLTYREVTPDNYVEGPFMFKRDGKYYFMWSEGGWTGPDYSVAYAIADSPFGPFKREGKILKQDPEIATGAGHHSCFNIPGTDKWYIVYHRRPLTETDGNSRVTCIDEMHFDDNGKILPVKMTNKGVKWQTIDAVGKVSQEGGADWSTFKYPEVIIVDKDNGQSEGSKLVKKMIPDLESFIKDISLGVCKTLYKSPDEVPAFETLVFELEDTDGVAYKMGNNPKIKIHMSTRYLADQYRRMGDEAITYEIAGINWHELTHAYQHSPRAKSREDHFGAIEGMADAVRITAGYHKTRKPRPGGNWNSGYTTTGFFMEWLQNTYDKDFVYKFNQSCRDMRPWSWDKACNSIAGKGIQLLWNEYQWHLKGGGSEAVAQFTVNKNIVGKGQEIKLENTSFNEPESYKWEFPGATPSSSTDKSPVIKYNAAGQYDITLSATNKDGSTTQTEKGCVLVLEENGSIVSLASIREGISCVPERAMPREGVRNLVDGNPETKYCTQSRASQIIYSLTKPAQLYVYSITSANDAPGRDPASWTLEGSNDNSIWEPIDTQKDVTFAGRYQKKQFLVKGNSKKYTYYRLDMRSKSDPIFQFADLELIGAF